MSELLKVNPHAIEGWRVAPNHSPGIYEVVAPGGMLVASGMSLSAATLVAATPRLLRFLSLIRESNPMWVDLAQVLRSAGLELEREPQS